MFVKSDATKINGNSEVHNYVMHIYVDVVHRMHHLWKYQQYQTAKGRSERKSC